MQMLLLKPMVVLLLWSMIMWLWLYATRLPAMSGKVDPRTMVGTTGSDLDKILPPRAQWKAHNYNHLMEQPTLFYAVVLALVASQNWSTVDVNLAWAYVILRIIHSLVQALWNAVIVRFFVFAAASFALFGLVLRAVTQILLTG